jgi:transposase
MVLHAGPSRDEDERAVVRRLSRARKAIRGVVMRARMVELSWARLWVPAIADELGCGQKTVRRWLHRFNRYGLEGLEDLGGQGRKRRITEAERSRIIALVKQVPPGRLEVQPGGDLRAADEGGPAEWTLDSLDSLDSLAARARQLGIEVGRSQVRRILTAEVADRLPGARVLATTLRDVPSAGVNDWSSAAWSPETGVVTGPRMPGLHVLDRIGSGDGFAAGLIHGLLTGAGLERALAYGTAHGALTMTTPGDVSMASLAEVEALIEGGWAAVRR